MDWFWKTLPGFTGLAQRTLYTARSIQLDERRSVPHPAGQSLALKSFPLSVEVAAGTALH
jgi:hypothetical protein